MMCKRCNRICSSYAELVNHITRATGRICESRKRVGRQRHPASASVSA